MSLIVLDAGISTWLVDDGRPRTRHLGVPVGGAADRAAFALANGLVGNATNLPGLEISLKGPTLRAEADVGCVVFGAPFILRTNRDSLTVGKTFNLRAGDELYIGGTPNGMRAYLCVLGGFVGDEVLGSRGGLTAIVAGERLGCSPSKVAARSLSGPIEFGWRPSTNPQREIRVVPGLQSSWFPPGELVGKTFAVTPASNRMGLRLAGDPLADPRREMVSEAVCPGSIQVTREGQCIILGVDGQTIGGYPKIAQVVAADLDLLGQFRPGEKIVFREVDLAEAERLHRERAALLHEWRTRLATSRGDGCGARFSTCHAAQPQ